jgi:hypothetical protein
MGRGGGIMASPTHFDLWLFAAPITLLIVVIVVVGLLRRTSEKTRRESETAISRRGPVSGGIIEGDPGQRNPGRHEAPRTDKPQDTRDDQPGD